MGKPPVTSLSLLKAISNSADSVRWTEFCLKYESVMRDFLRARYPSIDPDDAMQETLLALMKALPGYQYTPDTKGRFRNYLTGILAHKAADLLARNVRQAKIRRSLEEEAKSGLKMTCEVKGDAKSAFSDMRAEEGGLPYPSRDEEESWKITVMEAAMEQLLADRRVSSLSREVFRHIALLHEKPEEVAAKFGITRNYADQIKKRMIGKLAGLVKSMGGW